MSNDETTAAEFELQKRGVEAQAKAAGGRPLTDADREAIWAFEQWRWEQARQEVDDVLSMQTLTHHNIAIAIVKLARATAEVMDAVERHKTYLDNHRARGQDTAHGGPELRLSVGM